MIILDNHMHLRRDGRYIDAVKEFKEEEEGEIKDGEYFHSNYSLNKQYEICEKGIIVDKSQYYTLAVLVCHSPYIKDEKYVRISWWKGYQHMGMFKIYEKDVLINTIRALEKIDESFDDMDDLFEI